MIDPKLCDERHDDIKESLKLINSKLDIVIRNETSIKDLWKFVSVFLVIAGLVVGILKLFII